MAVQAELAESPSTSEPTAPSVDNSTQEEVSIKVPVEAPAAAPAKDEVKQEPSPTQAPSTVPTTTETTTQPPTTQDATEGPFEKNLKPIQIGVEKADEADTTSSKIKTAGLSLLGLLGGGALLFWFLL